LAILTAGAENPTMAAKNKCLAQSNKSPRRGRSDQQAEARMNGYQQGIANQAAADTGRAVRSNLKSTDRRGYDQPGERASRTRAITQQTEIKMRRRKRTTRWMRWHEVCRAATVLGMIDDYDKGTCLRLHAVCDQQVAAGKAEHKRVGGKSYYRGLF
jgi:hypothetical protein